MIKQTFLFLFILSACSQGRDYSDVPDMHDAEIIDGAEAPDQEMFGLDSTQEEVQQEFPLSGKWAIYGNDPRYGSYTGEAQFLEDDGGAYRFIRIIKYDTFKFEGLDVWSVWTGGAEIAGALVKIAASLKRADFVKKYKDTVRTEDDKIPAQVSGIFEPDWEKGTQLTLTGKYHIDGKVEIDETLTFESKEDSAIFEDEDLYYASHAEPEDHIKEAWFAIYKDFHELPFFEPYKTHPDFLKAVHYFPKKRTDFEFYRSNPGALRVVNKVIDEISLAETKLRADGYRYTLAEKAKLFDSLNRDKHIDKTTGMITAYLDGSEPLKNIPSGDGALWTGCYMAGQAYRYMVTKEEEALENMLRNLESLFILVDIPQDPKIFARAIRPHEGEGGNWKAGKGEFAHLDWLCCGNNDMFHGFEYGFLVAWQALPDSQEYDIYREKIIEKAIFLTENSPVVAESASHPLVMNLMLYYFTKEEKYLEKFEELISKGSYVLDYIAEGDGMIYMYGITDWSGQHLNTLTHITITQLAELMGDEEYLPFVLAGWVEGLKKTAEIRFVLWPLAAFAYAEPGDDLKYVLDEALWALKEFPYPKYSLDIDHSIRGGWLPSPWPALPWKMDYLTNPGRIQSLYATAYFERCSSEYSWKDNPLGFSCSASNKIDSAADYLHAYWFGRYYGVISAEE